ncbi:acylphosphatase [Photobacterium jeanii]|uniref:Acylphosphatase n=1 Tax=Photobacterium jeanii TaxID=858640 RepID=A0A178KJX2_9GAMM|nr:acylphosphatase [Photobacterium jeanii]OAN17658.1 acylphosphatase [Photobacterium jeanii]PST92685.1 acylphosphatase [Photobacterium jeanii]
MSQICVKAKIQGRVQGVGFRFHTAHEGLKHGLTGYAKNLPDGSVEVLACGHEEAINKLLAWLEQGPKTSNVTHLESDEVDWRHVDGFEIL